MSETYQIKDFYGTVMLKEWIRTLDDRQVMRVTGLCTLLKDEEITGFKMRGADSNWAIRVCGEKEQWTILGCQIRAVVAHAHDHPQSAESRLLVP